MSLSSCCFSEHLGKEKGKEDQHIEPSERYNGFAHLYSLKRLGAVTTVSQEALKRVIPFELPGLHSSRSSKVAAFHIGCC